MKAEHQFEHQFKPVSTFSWNLNRAERSRQVRWLAPLLERPDGRTWLMHQLNCPCTVAEAQGAEPFHLCFPLRDVLTHDYYQCRGNHALEDQFITYYNELFNLPEGFGVREIWRTAPGGEIRHPAAGGRAGWYDDFLRGRIDDQALYNKARDVRRMLGTEADVLLLTANYVVLVECKFRSAPSTEQFARHKMMGTTLARRLDKAFHFGMVVEQEHDPRFTQLDVPFVLWPDVMNKLEPTQSSS